MSTTWSGGETIARDWTSRPPGAKAVRVDVPDVVHARLRVMAAEAGLPMSQYVRELVLAAVRERHLDAAAEQEDRPKRKAGRKPKPKGS